MHDEAPAAADLAPLAQRIGAGDRVAEAEYARRFATPVHEVRWERTRDPATADDLTNEALMATHGSLRVGRIDTPERPSVFVYGAARNVPNNCFRARLRHPAEMALPADIPADPQADPVEVEERRGLVREALTPLNDTDRRILRMLFLDGLGPEKIVRTLRLRPDFGRARKSRAVKKLGEVVKTLPQRPSERPLDGRRRP